VDELIFASATELASAIRAKEVSSVDVVDAYLQRIEEVNPRLNAVVQINGNNARALARKADADLAKGHVKGPLHGVPITIKDNIEVAGMICTGGTKGRTSFMPKHDATIAARMRAAGAIILGKTNMPELGLAFETDNLVYGCTNNPYDPSCTPGGSSGGEAAIIAAGGSALGLGNDMGGSIRLPAHFCGITGLKPTSGRVPSTGTFPWPDSWLDVLWQNGPIARFVNDLIITLPIIAGPDWRDHMVVPMPLGKPDKVDLKTLRIAFYTDNGIMPSTTETVATIKKAVDTLSDAYLSVKKDVPKGIDQSFEIFLGLGAADGGVTVNKLLKKIGTAEMHPWLRALLDFYHSYSMTTPEFSSLMLKWTRFRNTMLSFMEKYDGIICPACAFPAQPHGTTLSSEKVPAFSYTMTYNLTGWPSVVVRGGTSPDGLPIGIQIVARPWREDIALAIAKHIETELGGWQRPLF